MDFTRTSTSFYSSKGFGNGFVSTAERFNDSSLYYSKYAPGPGDYHQQDKGTIVDDVNKMLFAKSLYNNKKTRSLKMKGQSPGPGHYNPIMDTFDLKWKINKYKAEDSVFKSSVPRFKKKKGLDVPGPGKYYKDEYFIDYNDKNKPKTVSHFFRKPQEKKEDALQKFGIKTKEVPNYSRISEDEKRKRGEGKNKNNNDGYNFGSTIARTKKDIANMRNKAFIYGSVTSKVPNLYDRQLIMANGGISSDIGMEYIHKILHKPEKPDIFELYAPRWKKNELELKVPGPAYYHPKNQPKTLSFNKNTNDFIVTPGVSNPDADNPIADI